MYLFAKEKIHVYGNRNLIRGIFTVWKYDLSL